MVKESSFSSCNGCGIICSGSVMISCCCIGYCNGSVIGGGTIVYWCGKSVVMVVEINIVGSVKLLVSVLLQHSYWCRYYYVGPCIGARN